MLRPALLAPGASLAASLAAPATAAAQAATPPATIEACYVPVSGTIYRISTAASPAAGAPTRCLSSAHVQFSWRRQPFSDVSEVVTERATTPDAGGRRSASAVCPAGKMAVGGSYAIFASGGNYAWGIVPVSSGTFATSFDPAAPPDAFFVLTVDAPGYGGAAFFRVSVKCARAS